MGRKAATPKKPVEIEKPELFVGSSGEAARLASTVVQLFRHEFRVTPWTAGVFEPSSTPLQDLVRQLDKSAFGIFIFAKDDRDTSRRKEYATTRDNVLFELGLFMGKLGPESCFILVPKDRKDLKIPSDLEGFTLVSYEDDRLEDNAQAAFAGAYADIFAAIERRRKSMPSPPSPEVTATPTKPLTAATAPDARVKDYLQDLLGMVHLGAAGIEIIQRDQEKFLVWAKNVLHMTRLALKAVTKKLPADAYVAWLRPTEEDRERIVFFLGDPTSPDFGSAHHPFSLKEGLAGTVWAEGQPGVHSPAKPHPQWRPRAECQNESYVCVPVGKAAGAGGVLGFGSDQGFETRSEQISVMEAFAALLAAVVPAGAWWTPERGKKTRKKT